ncbi:MAG: UDP-N-acetylglucosamine 2-epimerase [Pseudomonadota bacterium]
MRTIGIVTTARSDYGLYVPLLRLIQQDPDLDLRLYVTGMHLSPEFGNTFEAILKEGFQIHERVEMLLSSDTPAGIAKSMGLGTIGFAESFSRFQPDLLVVLGDRFEMHAGAMAALPFRIPLAHIHGGESTESAIDDLMRHSITKMSHLHFASTELYALRIVQMGEEPWRVLVSGAPGLDNLLSLDLLTRDEFAREYGFHIDESTLLVTFHPVTLEYEHTESYVMSLLHALEEIGRPVIFTYPNADTGGRKVIRMINAFRSRCAAWQVAVNLGTKGYLNLMRHVAAMVGNSSSGIFEAASFKLPVVNIGARQRGRLRPKNVIDVGYSREDIVCGVHLALSSEFRTQLSDLVNPFGDGRASERIVERLKTVRLGSDLLVKKFHDVQWGKSDNPA